MVTGDGDTSDRKKDASIWFYSKGSQNREIFDIYLRICRFEKENNVIDSKAQRLLFAFSEHIARPRNRLTCLEAVFFDKSSWFQCRLRLVGSEMAPSFSSQRGVFWPAKRSNRIIMTRWV